MVILSLIVIFLLVILLIGAIAYLLLCVDPNSKTLIGNLRRILY